MLLRSRTSTTSGPVPPLAREYQFDGLLGMALAMAALAFFTPSVSSQTAQDQEAFCPMCHAICLARACSYWDVMPGLTLLTWISQTVAADCVCAAARVAARQTTTSNRNGLRIRYDLLKIFLFDLSIGFYTFAH